jgi:outer membrane protein OmpA-like peptidoglycan-associated protein
MASLPERRAGRAAATAAALVWMAALACASAGPPAPAPAAPRETATSPELEPVAQRCSALPGARVERFPDHVVVSLPSDALFTPGKAALAPVAPDDLAPFAEAARALPDTKLEVRTYTDAQGSESFNLTLSEDRADAVRRWLVGEGVPADRVSAEGLGAQFPVAGNDTPEGRNQNRRVEIEMRAPAGAGAAPTADTAKRP